MNEFALSSSDIHHIIPSSELSSTVPSKKNNNYQTITKSKATTAGTTLFQSFALLLLLVEGITTTTATRQASATTSSSRRNALPLGSRNKLPGAFLHPNKQLSQNHHRLCRSLSFLHIRGGTTEEEHNYKMTKNGDNFDDDASTYNQLVSSAVDITDGYVRNGLLTVTRSSRDIDNNQRRSFLYNIPILPNNSPIITPPTELPPKIKLRLPSPSGNKIAILLLEDEQQIIEIWGNHGQSLQKRIVIPEKLHGKISTDKAGYGSMQWNVKETALVYCAERNPIKTTSFFDKNNDTAKEKKEEKEVKGGQYTLGIGIGENWGEKYTTTVLLDLYILNVSTGKVGLIDNVPSSPDKATTTEGGYLLGQPIFTPNGKEVVYTAWDAGSGGNMPKRLGSTYCRQRFSKIYVSSVNMLLERLSFSTEETEEEKQDEAYTCLTPNDALVRSPRFFYDEEVSKLAFLSNTRGFDTHVGCMELQLMDWNSNNGLEGILKTRRTIIPEIRQPQSSEDEQEEMVANMSFPGLFLDQLPESCFIDNGKYIVLTTQWGSISKVILVSTEDGSVAPVNVNLLGNGGDDNSKEYASQGLLCLTDDQKGLILSQVEPNKPAVLGYVSTQDLLEKKNGVTAKLLAALSPIAASSHSDVLTAQKDEGNDANDENISYNVLTMNPPHGDVDVPVQCILLLPPKKKMNENEKIPLIVVPHGGPHSCTSTTYVPSYAYICQQGGYGILHVNYRGSSGFGQDGIECLPGACGSLDVKDVVHATKRALDSYASILDSDRVGICGGSHGGYLAGHCTGQYPNLFKVSAMRNPVTNIASMVTATDIMDWCYVEAFGVGKYDWTTFRGPKKDELGAMFDASPIAHVENVCAPTLVALGMSDKRVPPSQGLEFYHTLRSNGVKTKLLMYEKDDHPIDRVQSEADHWMNIKLWFDEHL